PFWLRVHRLFPAERIDGRRRRMMPDLGISQVQVGWLEWAFILGHAAFQFPGGVIGQRLGARVMFTVIGAIAFLATVLTRRTMVPSSRWRWPTWCSSSTKGPFGARRCSWREAIPCRLPA